ncbi:S8 family peptidase [Cognatilysobacter bugurensis]|uniref:Serine protease n=1 Tax=Cognatilysobacter bugurensis TaxID=543356 RepID=A0A918W956_9GAMM|nr:S8 family peptidase [Lysobacter bugurensis]GHA88721.1 serine protease [Lysobacter bugurensis]
MTKRVLALAVTLALGSSAAAAADLVRAERNRIEGQYIVVLDPARLQTPPGLARAPGLAVAAENAAVDLASRHGGNVERVYGHALQGFSIKAPEHAIARMLKDPRVAFIEEDAMSYPSATQSGATWGLDRSDQRALPLNGSYVYDYTASTVRAYVIDSGILASHQDFGGRVLAGATAISDGRGTSDCNGHGTHVAGTIGGATWGVAKSVRLVPVRVFGCTGGSSNSTIISGIDWVRANHVKPAVANMSLGGGASSAIDTATNNLINAGVTVVVAAGNDNQNACNYSPARVSNAVTVGSTQSNDYRSSFSNYGSCVNIFAPGTSIKSAWYTSNTATNTISGTSMASPHVAGAAALYLSRYPSSSPSTVRSWLYNNATTGRLYSINSGSPNRLLYTR